ncbi:MAG: single-stranded DNA-binding protein [Candidatus Brocadiae bacterium]|nr:single-stranded DNA-binding protein [Candidatus Brocadiia bacterium]
MPNFNRVILMGNLTRDPELRYTPSGQAVADLSLAINRRTRTQEGEQRDNTTYVDVTAWGRQAEVIKEYFTRGRPIFIEGRLQLDKWTSQDGQRRSKLRVVLEQFEFVTPRGSESRPAADGGSRPAPRGQNRAAAAADADADADAAPPSDDDDFGPEALDDDVPF